MRYGTRFTHRRKGYLFTALAAVWLLAASPGTAQAQVEITGPDEVTEGVTATYTVAIKGFIPPGNPADATATVTLAPPSPDSDPAATEGEADDISTSLGLTVTFQIPEAPDAGDDPVAFSSSGVIRVQTLQDLDAEDDNFTLQFSMTAGGLQDEDGDPIELDGDQPEGLSIEDDEDQEYKLTTDDDDAKEGDGTIMVTVTANPAHVDGSMDLAVQLDAPRSIASITVPTTATVPTLDVNNRSADITITLGGNDKNRVEDTITVSVHSGSAGNSELVDSLSIDIEDKDALPAVAMMVVDEDGRELALQPTSVKEGESVKVVVTVVDKDGDTIEAKENLKVALMPTGTADSADYTVVGSSDIAINTEMSGVIEIEVRGSDDDVGVESLMFDAVVSGDSANGPGTRPSPAVLLLYIEDATETKINTQDEADAYPKIRAALGKDPTNTVMNPGDTGTIMTSDLFEVIPGYEATYGVSVDSDSLSASASRNSITIDAKSATGAVPAKVTVTGTARMMSPAFAPSQSVSNVAELTFEVTVVDTTLVVTLSADPMEINEGDMSTITATANRYVTVGDGDVAIALTVVGDGTLDPESIMIAMGEMRGSTMLTAAVDDDMDNETLTVVATGDGVTGLMQVEVAVTDTTAEAAEPVPALPLIAQLLLGLGLLGGGARRLYRRRFQG